MSSVVCFDDSKRCIAEPTELAAVWKVVEQKQVFVVVCIEIKQVYTAVKLSGVFLRLKHALRLHALRYIVLEQKEALFGKDNLSLDCLS